MKSLFSWLLLAVVAAGLSGCSTCYTEGYQPLYNAHGYRADGIADDPQLTVYSTDDLHVRLMDETPDLLGPTLGLDPHFPAVPVVPEP